MCLALNLIRTKKICQTFLHGEKKIAVFLFQVCRYCDTPFSMNILTIPLKFELVFYFYVFSKDMYTRSPLMESYIKLIHAKVGLRFSSGQNPFGTWWIVIIVGRKGFRCARLFWERSWTHQHDEDGRGDIRCESLNRKAPETSELARVPHEHFFSPKFSLPPLTFCPSLLHMRACMSAPIFLGTPAHLSRRARGHLAQYSS